MAERIILGVQLTNRLESILDVQKILTEYGCNIRHVLVCTKSQNRTALLLAY
jgi:hypothetical protein